MFVYVAMEKKPWAGWFETMIEPNALWQITVSPSSSRCDIMKARLNFLPPIQSNMINQNNNDMRLWWL